MLMFGIYSAPPSQGGALFLDATPYVTSGKFSTGEHGFERLTASIRTPLQRAFRLYDQMNMAHAGVYDNGTLVWEGRIEDVAINQGGMDISALGYWRALSDIPYTAMWSDTVTSNWRPILQTEEPASYPNRYDFDTQGRLFITPREVSTQGAWTINGIMGYIPIDGGDRRIVAVTFDYAFLAPVNWIASINRYNNPWTFVSAPWTLNSTGVLQTGTQTLTFAACDKLLFAMVAAYGPFTYNPDTGNNYLRITNVRVKTTTSTNVYADEIARGLVSYVAGVNNTQLSTSAAFIQSPGVDLKNEAYEDQLPSDILTRLAALGDNQTPPRRWEVGVYEDQQLFFRPRGSNGKTWYVDVADLGVERSVDALYNSVYATYQDTSNRTLRTTVNTDSASVARYGITRRMQYNSDTTNGTQAGVHRDTILNDRKEPTPKARISVSGVYNSSGAKEPAWKVRSGDTIIIRNINPVLSAAVDKIKNMRVFRTDYDMMSGEITIEPEMPADTLEFMLTRQSKGL